MFHFTAKSYEELRAHWFRIFGFDLPNSSDRIEVTKTDWVKVNFPNREIYMVETWDIYNILPTRTYEVFACPHKKEFRVRAMVQ